MPKFRIRTLLIGTAIICLILAGLAWFQNEFHGPSQCASRILNLILSLESMQPADMTASQWKEAVGWTVNLHGNSLAFRADYNDLRQLEARLREKIEKDVDFTTLEWIWEQYAQLTEHGRRYQKYKMRMNPLTKRDKRRQEGGSGHVKNSVIIAPENGEE